MNNKPRGLRYLLENIDELKKKIPHDEIMDLARNAPEKNGIKDRFLVFHALRKNQVADALVDADKAKKLNHEIISGLYQGRDLPNEYIEWLNIYLNYSTPPKFCKNKRGRKPIEINYEQLDILDLCLREIQEKGEVVGVVNTLKAAAKQMIVGYETIRDLYYSEQNKEQQKIGKYITI